MNEIDAHAVRFIAVAGNIATGKSGLVERLASALGASALLEKVAENPYFDRFYEDPARWAFHSQVAFVADSLSRHIKAIDAGPAIQDRTVYEAVDVFGALLHQLGHLSSTDVRVLTRFRESARELPRQPTLLLYLHAPTTQILDRIAIRDRTAERHITLDYVTRLVDLYTTFIKSWTICPVLSIDTAARDLRLPEEVEGLAAEISVSHA